MPRDRTARVPAPFSADQTGSRQVQRPPNPIGHDAMICSNLRSARGAKAAANLRAAAAELRLPLPGQNLSFPILQCPRKRF